MKKYGLVVLVVSFWVGLVWGADSGIRLNSLGFLPDGPKKATVIQPCSAFQVKDMATGQVVYSGKALERKHQADVDQATWTLNFSAFQALGRYYVEVPDVGRSTDFVISLSAYDEAFKTAMQGFYLWRCGTEIKAEYQGQTYAKEACHLEDGYQDFMGLDTTEKRDGTGGWHDAGDYGKYTVNAGITMGCLFMAWDQFEARLKNVDLDLPNTGPGYPDFLKELKWETDWLLKMAYPDGSGRVSHKLTRLEFSGFVMPSEDKDKRYFTDWGTAAIASFSAQMAMASRYFRPCDAAYADTCLAAARLSDKFLKAHPEYKRWNQRQFTTGGYRSRDEDDRLWAAAELWQTTGEVSFLKDFESQATGRKGRVDENWDWGDVSNLALFTYVHSKREGRDPSLLASIRKSLIEAADQIVDQAKADVYARPLAGRYYWGCNGTIARQVMTLQMANEISPDPKYKDTALDAIAHIFGRNYYNRSFVTGLGLNPPMNPHDRRSGADDIEAPWPGYIVGGGLSAIDWVDIQDSYRTNEIAINWQGALVYALAGFIQ